MAVTYNNIRSKVSRAVCAYLVGQSVGTADDTYHVRSKEGRAYPNTTVLCPMAKPEIQFTGNYRVTVRVSIKGSAVSEEGEQNEEAARLAFEERVSKTHDALMQSDDGHTLSATAEAITAAGRALADASSNDADMEEFTVLQWIEAGFGDGDPDSEGCAWEEVLYFEAICCGSAID